MEKQGTNPWQLSNSTKEAISAVGTQLTSFQDHSKWVTQVLVDLRLVAFMGMMISLVESNFGKKKTHICLIGIGETTGR